MLIKSLGSQMRVKEKKGKPHGWRGNSQVSSRACKRKDDNVDSSLILFINFKTCFFSRLYFENILFKLRGVSDHNPVSSLSTSPSWQRFLCPYNMA